MTTNQLANAIAATLTQHFPDIPVHPANGGSAPAPDTQGLTYRPLSAKLTRERGERFVQSHTFEIRWLDASNIPDTLPDRLFEALETIEVEGMPYRATELRWKTWGQIPKLLVYYTMRITKVSESATPMQQLKQRPTALKTANE